MANEKFYESLAEGIYQDNIKWESILNYKNLKEEYENASDKNSEEMKSFGNLQTLIEEHGNTEDDKSLVLRKNRLITLNRIIKKINEDAEKNGKDKEQHKPGIRYNAFVKISEILYNSNGNIDHTEFRSLLSLRKKILDYSLDMEEDNYSKKSIAHNYEEWKTKVFEKLNEINSTDEKENLDIWKKIYGFANGAKDVDDAKAQTELILKNNEIDDYVSDKKSRKDAIKIVFEKMIQEKEQADKKINMLTNAVKNHTESSKLIQELLEDIDLDDDWSEIDELMKTAENLYFTDWSDVDKTLEEAGY